MTLFPCQSLKKVGYSQRTIIHRCHATVAVFPALFIDILMLFSTPQFFAFFLVSTLAYLATPLRYRSLLLLVTSYYFYMCWRAEFALLLAGITLVNYFSGLRIALSENPRTRKRYLWLSLACNLGVLFFFKYCNFFSHSINEFLAATGRAVEVPLFDILLPVGISFFTFQSLGYVIDVYYHRIKAEQHLGRFALFVAFWPQLLAGPINRAGLLLPQLKNPPSFDYERVIDGFRLILWGLILKMVIADHLAVYVNRVFDNVGDYKGLPLLIGACFYAVEIYCDFFGYTNIARGAARVLGFELMENFKRPYLARSVREFWQRWHISLSTWFRDYLYIPLGGNRAGKGRWYSNLLITFLLSGLWHGAQWSFVIWGGIHGCLLIIESITGTFQKRIADRLFPGRDSRCNTAVQIVLTIIPVWFAWIFFRANTLQDALTYISRMVQIEIDHLWYPVVSAGYFCMCVMLILLLLVVELFAEKIRITEYFRRLSMTARWSMYTLGVWAVLLSAVFGVRQEFIYFQF